MARTLAQLDLAVAALEGTVPRIQAGLMETLRQNTLALESEYQTLLGTVGVGSDVHGNPTGVFSTFASINSRLADLQTQIDTVNATAGTVSEADTSAIAQINASLTLLDAAVSALQAKVATL